MDEQLTNALIAAGQADKNAEKYLEDLSQQNYGELMRALAQEIGNESKGFVSRQMACLYIKNTLAAQSSAVQKEKHERWKSLPAPLRAECKQNIMAAMRSSSNPDLPHFVAVAAAEIGVVELPYREWDDLVGNLMQNVTAAEAHEKIKIASLECLGYICDRIVDVEELIGTIPELDSTIVDQMLTTIVDAVQPGRPDDLRYSALQALKNSLLFVRKNMDNKQERDFIMSAICEACKHQQPRIRVLAFQCVDTVAEYYYEVLQDYMTNIYQLTTEVIQNDSSEDSKSSAIEVWNTLSEMESALIEEERDAAEMGAHLSRPPCPRYVQAAMEHLVPLLTKLLTLQNEDDEDDTQNLQDTSATCIELISQTVEAQIVPFVMPYVTNNISSENWRERDAAIVAFMAILDGPSTADVGQYVDQSIQVMLQSFQDNNVVVRGSAVHCVRKICAHHLSGLSADRLNSILNAVDQKLTDRPSIAAPACSAIYEICQGLKQVDPPPTNILSAGLVQLITHLMSVTDRPDSSEHNIRVVAMSAACAVIQASAMDINKVFADLLPAIVQRLEAALAQQVVSNDDKEFKAQLIGQLSALIQTLYQRMDKADVLPQTDRVMTCLLQALNVRNAADEVFMAISAVVSNLEEDFAKYAESFVPALLQGLGSLELTNLCLICTGGVVDLCGGLGSLIQPFADSIMEAMFNIIRDVSVHRDVKPAVISCFGDMAMAIGAAYQPYMQLTMMLLMQASQQQAPADNEDMIAFINKLRCAVLEAYSGILVGLAEGGAIDGFFPNLPNVLTFLSQLATDSTKDETVLAKSVTLLGDIGHEMGARPEVKQQLTQTYVAQLIREALSSPNETIRTDSQWAAQVVENAVKS
mmetsp:Transcript_40929/g.85225  ORF Transcript_40929/g.85225 Transcript_40929/m.85225 type:complete len:867 (-) Transcript_40929:202-2802(-)